MLRAISMACVLACAASPAFAQHPPERCGVLQRVDAERVNYIPIDGYTILLGQPPFSAPPGAVDAVVCDRTSIFLGHNDHRVITDLGVPLYIRNAGRVAVLEMSEGQLRVRFAQGAPSPTETEAMRTALDRAQEEIRNMNVH